MTFYYKPKSPLSHIPATAKPTVSSTKSASSKKPSSVKKPSSASKKAASTKAEPKQTEEVSNQIADKKERKRRDVSKESVDTDFEALQARIETEIARLRESTEKVRGIKFLRSINKALKTLHSDTKRVMKLKKKNNRKKTVVSGFLKPIKISAELAAFTGWDVNGTYSRVNVTKHICDYIKNNKLFNEEDKRLIIVDTKLKALLKYDPSNPPLDEKGNQAPLNYFRLQKYLKPHFIKFDAPASKDDAKSEGAAKTKTARAKSAPVKTSKGSKKVVVEDDDEDDVEEEDLDE